MTTAVADRTSNKNEQIVLAAEIIGRSKYRAGVFREIYRGKRARKTVSDLMVATGFPRNRVLDAAKRLADHAIVGRSPGKGESAYTKVDFFQQHRDRVLRLSSNRAAREAVPTKSNPAGSRRGTSIRVNVKLSLPRKSVRAHRITVDEIESFSRVRKVPDGLDYVPMPESQFKQGVARILGEREDFKDWGGELRDLSSSRVRLEGERKMAAFAFKGPGKKGRLFPGHMGKNGDQIQRLARCSADVFLVQYWAGIDDSVVEQLELFMRLKSFLERRDVWYGIIDGSDSARLIQAYPRQFPVRKGVRRGSHKD